MALQNRVTPFGEIVPISARGTLMGNRGCLHNAQRQLVRTQASRKDWVTCRLQFKDRRRPLMSPGKYTELFFLDEATALAAGHRPCNVCRPERLALFKQSWAVGVLLAPGARLLVGQIDSVLHQDRVGSKRAQCRFAARIGELPDGAMVQLGGEVGIARLMWRGRLFTWTAEGYQEPQSVDADTEVIVLTPACTVKVLAAGYVPEVHATVA